MRLNCSITIFVAIALPFFTLQGRAQEVKYGLNWYTDIEKVYALSKETKRPIFAYFTGSDWCGWCHRLERNVFEKNDFQEWAKDHVILLEVDFPHSKKLPDALANQNAYLQQFFSVRGYPTIWLFYMNKDTTNNKFKISALGSLGYPNASPGSEAVTFLNNANRILNNK
jgi:protein disulfide-isomerase